MEVHWLAFYRGAGLVSRNACKKVVGNLNRSVLWMLYPVCEQVDAPALSCEGMARQWVRLIGFGVPGWRTTSRTVNLCVPVPQANGGTVLAVTPIDYCPWCAAPVETVGAKWTEAASGRGSMANSAQAVLGKPILPPRIELIPCL